MIVLIVLIFILMYFIKFCIDQSLSAQERKKKEVEWEQQRQIAIQERRRVKVEQEKQRQLAIQERKKMEEQYIELQVDVLMELGFSNWNIISFYDEYIIVKSRQMLDKYDVIKFFKEYGEKLSEAENIVKRKNEVVGIFTKFLENNKYRSHAQYAKLVKQIDIVLSNANAYRVKVEYISSVGNKLGFKSIDVTQEDLDKFKNDPSLLMSKTEYNKFVKERQKEHLNMKQSKYYDIVNNLIDYANKNKDSLVIKGSQEQLDSSVSLLIDRTVNNIKKIKAIDSEEWEIINKNLHQCAADIDEVVGKNKSVIKYYMSNDFQKVKDTCEILMSTQREFNEYINEKVDSISRLFGTRIVREETINNDEYVYIRPYKKTITPFTAEVSATVFASAENKSLEYIVKYFYPNKNLYPEQIQKLHQLVEELETLKDAKQIIENYKAEYQQYLEDVPTFIIDNDESGFYERLGFANIDESVLTIEYKFSYTSGGGLAKRSFTVPMTEENIIELINTLNSKLTREAFIKEQRILMTKKLRESIKKRDHFTCCSCRNSIHNEPNLLLEIDHIIPVSKGGYTVNENLQTLCWKCNRSKSDKIIS